MFNRDSGSTRDDVRDDVVTMRSLTGDILEFDLRSQSFMGPAMKCSDMSTIDPNELRRSIAVIFQDFIRYHLPARDNIGLGRLDAIDDLDAIRDAARHAGADAFLEALPSGYQTMLGPEFIGGTDLSIGQWQRMALARAFVRDAEGAGKCNHCSDDPSASANAEERNWCVQSSARPWESANTTRTSG